MKVVVTGSRGLLGGAVTEHFSAAGDEVIALDRSQVDIGDRVAVREILERERPDWIVNAAAWTDVDGCETDQQRNIAANALGPGNLALEGRRVGAGLITISTDYVFDGTKDGFYTQRDDPSPLSEYGKAKLHGERLAQAANARTIVVRVGWLFGKGGRNFLSKIPELIASGANIKAIGDSFGTPTYAPDMALRLRELALLDIPGIYHMANGGEGTSYAGFAREAAGTDIPEIAASTLKRPAPRPTNSRLRCILQPALGLGQLRPWTEALAEFIRASTPSSTAAGTE
ncbi:MAG TPA: dTDP-4-dehydrorhamnose reductase [Pyrinomonadaceae bacterium]|nr:dTDP-4-dehydrorhamnose reductase [Pyrinomonadaceae bacterium]